MLEKVLGSTWSARVSKLQKSTRWPARGALALLVIIPLTEHGLEARDRAKMTASDTFANVQGADIRYRVLGKGKPGPTLVFLSGMAGSLEQWDYVQTSLSNTFQTLSYDRAGYGFSQGASAHDAAEQADELSGLLTSVRITQPVVLIGFSNSVSIARVFASRHGKQTGGMFLIDPYLPEIEGRVPGHHGQFRGYYRWLFHESTLTFFGLRRLLDALHDPPPLELDRKTQAVLASFRHWYAVDREWLATSATAEQTIASGGLDTLPISLVYVEPHPGELGRVSELLYRELVGRSTKGTLTKLPPSDHGALIKQGTRSVETIVGMIRDLGQAVGAGRS